MAKTDRIKKALSIAIAIGLATSAGAAIAQNAPAQPPAAGTANLQLALEQLAAANADVQSLKVVSGDRDQGDENASPRAKQRVCTKDPAAQRSAICPVSPQ